MMQPTLHMSCALPSRCDSASQHTNSGLVYAGVITQLAGLSANRPAARAAFWMKLQDHIHWDCINVFSPHKHLTRKTQRVDMNKHVSLLALCDALQMLVCR